MRILLTGINGIQCGHIPKMSYISSILALKSCLKELGHEVDVKPVKIKTEGINSNYDKIIVFLAPVTGFLARHTFGALWSLLENDCLISFDDWQIPQIFSSMKSLLTRWDKCVGENQFNYADLELAKPDFGRYQALLTKLAAGAWNNKVLLPCYKGGDLSKLQIPVQVTQLYTYNPAIIFKNYYGSVENYENRPKQWVLASLHNHQSWLKKQNLKWQVNQFGVRSLDQPRLTEKEIFENYKVSAGVLSPPYKTCGSGWWRARHGLAADAFCVVGTGAEELTMIGNSYTLKPGEIENNTILLKDLAYAQKEEFWKAAGTKEELLETVNNFVGF